MTKKGKRFSSMLFASLFLLTSTFGNGFKPVKAEKLSTKELAKQILQQKLEESTLKTKDKAESLNENAPLKKDNPNEIVRVIVQLKGTPSVKGSKSTSEVISSQNDIKSQVEKLSGAKLQKSFGYLVNGFSMDVKRSEIDKIKAVSGVSSVTEAKMYYTDMKNSNELTQAYSVWKDYGFKGEGMVVSIIDTGIDYTHKDMKLTDPSKAKLNQNNVLKAGDKGKFYTDKVPYGYNFADENQNVTDSGVGEFHGMHVAGIVAANGNASDVDTYKAVQGVAPEAQVLAMKVFSNNKDRKGAYDDDVIAAIESSVLHGADIINMSLGSSAGFQDENDPEQLAIKNATDKGVLCVISAGNSAISTTQSGWNTPQTNLLGTVDTAMVGAPGLSKDSLCVASYENTKKLVYAFDFVAGSTQGKVNYAIGGGEPEKVITDLQNVVDCNIGQTTDFTSDVKGKVALIKRGTLSFSQKVLNAQNAGAIGAIVYDNKGNDPLQMSVDASIAIPSVGIGNADGLKLKSYLPNLQVKFTGALVSMDNSIKDDMSPFTSFGPTPNLDFKPEISGVGGNVYSTINNNKYEVMNGTSMASPDVAGSEALVIQALKTKNLGLSGRDLVEFAKNTVINTAKVLVDKNYGNGTVPYTPRRQGAGLIQTENAINNSVIAVDDSGKAAFSLKEIGKTKSFDITLKNYDSKSFTYNLSGNVLSEKVLDEYGHFSDYVIPGATLTFSNSSVTVPAKGQIKVTATITLPDSFSSEQFAEGYINLTNTDSKSPSLVVPYIGFYGSWSKPAIVDQPAWSNDSLIGRTGLVRDKSVGSNGYATHYLGLSNGSIDPNKIAISPNNDSLADTAIPYLSFLRNAKTVDVNIVTKDGETEKVIRHVSTDNKVSRDFLDSQDGDGGIKFYGTGSWDGSYYNAKTGEMEVVPDGQYYLKVSSKVDLPNATAQDLYFPVKVDTKAPKVTITSGESSNGNGTYTVKFKVSDEGVGINPAYTMIFVNGNSVKPSISYDSASDTYSADVNIESGVPNEIAVDYALNIGESTVKVDSPVVFSNVNDGLKLGSNDVDKDNIYVVKGSVTSKVAELTINGTKADINSDLSFTAPVKLTSGDNSITVSGKDTDGKDLVTKGSYTVSLDTVKPVISITSPTLLENDVVNTTSNAVELKGKVTDDLSSAKDLTVKCNDTALDDSEYDASTGEFDVIAPVSGNTKVTLEAADASGNTVTKTITVIATINDAPLNITFDNLKGFTVMDPAAIHDDTFTITGTVNHKPDQFKINGNDVTVNNDNTFSMTVKLSQGANKFLVYAVDKGQTTPSYNYTYEILYDSEKPVFTITDPKVWEDGKVYINTDTLTIKGSAYDNTYGYTLFVNGDCVVSRDNFPNAGEIGNKKDFSYDVKVVTGDIVTIDMVDEFGNETVKKYEVVVDKTAPTAPVITSSNTAATNKDVLVKLASDPKDTDVTKIEYSFDNTNFVPYSSPLAIEENATVYARAYDKAGNVSSVSSLSVNNIDKVAPVVTVSGIEDGGKYDGKLAAPLINATDNVKLASLVETLDGKPYDGKDITAVGDHNLVITATDSASNVTTKSYKFTVNAVITSATSSSDVTNVVSNSSSNNVVFTLSGTTVLSSNVLNGLVGLDKQITIVVNAPAGSVSPTVTWIFNTKDIDKSKIKDIDLSMNDTSAFASAIGKTDKNAQILSFKYHGDLPAPAQLKVKVDPKLVVNGKVFFYYYNPDTKKAELIKGTNQDGSWNVDGDGYALVTITHCSDYFFSSVAPVSPKSGSLPKTGSFIDTNIMLAFGSLFIASGAAFIWKRRKRA